MKRIALLVGLFVVVVLAAACGSSDSESFTAVRLRVRLDPALQITQIELASGPRRATIPSAPGPVLGAVETLTVMVDDAAAGTPMRISLWGRAGGLRVAHGEAQVTPRSKTTVDVEATLNAGPGCKDECQANVSECAGAEIRKCGPPGEDGCRKWLAPAACPSGESCSAAGGECKRSACPWVLSTVENFSNVTTASSIKVDAQRTVHVSYQDDATQSLMYAYRVAKGGSWIVEPVAPSGFAGQSALAIAPTSGVHIAYSHTAQPRELRMAHRAGSGTPWTTTTIDAIGTRGPDPAIAIAPSGAVRVSYLRGDIGELGGALKFAESAGVGAPWNVQTLDDINNSGDYSSMVVDGAGNTFISYYEVFNHNLKFLELGATPRRSFIDENNNVGTSSSLGIDAGGNLHVAYYDYSNETVKYARRAKGSDRFNNPEVLDADGNAGRYTALAVSSSGEVHIVYYVQNGEKLNYLHGDGTTWSKSTLDTGVRPGAVSITVDPAGGIHASYIVKRSDTSNSLKHAYLCE